MSDTRVLAPALHDEGVTSLVIDEPRGDSLTNLVAVRGRWRNKWIVAAGATLQQALDDMLAYIRLAKRGSCASRWP